MTRPIKLPWILVVAVNLSFINASNLCKHSNGNNNFRWRAPLMVKTCLTDSSVEAMPAVAPAKLTWDMLKDITYEKRWNEDYAMHLYYPVIGKKIKQFAGRDLYITGYMIPLDVDAGLYALSKFNYASCFFCGGAGPESVVSLKFSTKPRRYKTDEYLTMKGKLVLNDTDINEFVYVFKNTEEFKP